MSMRNSSSATRVAARLASARSLATSSAHVIIDAVLGRLGLETAFEVRCSALDDAQGKPAPDVYLRAARDLGVAPARCVAIEDSVAGARSARAAGMFVVAIPAPEQARVPEFEEADLRIASLEELASRMGSPLRPR